jgi:predicted kinase
MLELIICRGIPASGKTTFAKEWIKEPGRIRVSRDDIRMQCFGVEFGCDENLVTKIEHGIISSALQNGTSVIVDDTNIRHKYVKAFADIGYRYGADVQIKHFDIDLDVAIERNNNRERKVPQSVIKDMYNRLKSSASIDLELYCVEPYIPDTDKPRAIIVDIDGTIAEMNGRGPYEWKKVGSDKVRHNIVNVVRALNNSFIILVSGRDEVCRPETEEWLQKNYIPYDYLYMRPENDNRKDSSIKLEIFNKYIRDNFYVWVCLDDRPQVIRLWEALGINVLHCGNCVEF